MPYFGAPSLLPLLCLSFFPKVWKVIPKTSVGSLWTLNQGYPIMRTGITMLS